MNKSWLRPPQHLCLITCSKVLELDILRFLTYVAHRIIHCILIALPCESHEEVFVEIGFTSQQSRDSQGGRRVSFGRKQ